MDECGDNWNEGKEKKKENKSKRDDKRSETNTKSEGGMERVSKIEIQLCCREISLREIFGSWYTACPSPGWERGMQ